MSDTVKPSVRCARAIQAVGCITWPEEQLAAFIEEHAGCDGLLAACQHVINNCPDCDDGIIVIPVHNPADPDGELIQSQEQRCLCWLCRAAVAKATPPDAGEGE